jgi:uncharacterized SAM-binding protein YcdF (DUF218 family)
MKKAIIVLGGSLWKDKNIWRTINVGQGEDESGFINDRWRVIAAYYLWQQDTEFLIVTSGGKGQLTNVPGAPTVSSVIKRELEEMGVPGEAILEEDNSGNTYEQLKVLPTLARTNKIGKLIVISNEWHLSRIKAMLERSPGLAEAWSSIQLELIAAEEILLRSNPNTWSNKVLKARESPEMKKRLALEEKGVQDIYSGNYKY